MRITNHRRSTAVFAALMLCGLTAAAIAGCSPKPKEAAPSAPGANASGSSGVAGTTPATQEAPAPPKMEAPE